MERRKQKVRTVKNFFQQEFLSGKHLLYNPMPEMYKTKFLPATTEKIPVLSPVHAFYREFCSDYPVQNQNIWTQIRRSDSWRPSLSETISLPQTFQWQVLPNRSLPWKTEEAVHILDSSTYKNSSLPPAAIHSVPSAESENTQAPLPGKKLKS